MSINSGLQKKNQNPLIMAPFNLRETSHHLDYIRPTRYKDAVSVKHCEPPCTSPGLIYLELGNHKTTILPIFVLTFVYLWVTVYTMGTQSDPRITSLFFMNNPFSWMAICFLYTFAAFVWGPRFMENRQPIRAKRIKFIYHTIKVVVSVYIFIKSGLTAWFFNYSWRCQPVDYSDNDQAIAMVRLTQLFAYTKILDFGDTAFFILEKRWIQVSQLHVVHHAGMCFSMFFGGRYSAGGHLTFLGFMNSGAHAAVHFYNILALCGPSVRPYLWWKKYLMWVQMVEYFAVFAHTAQLYFYTCFNVPMVFVHLTLFYSVVFIFLFCDFRLRLTHAKMEKNNNLMDMATLNEPPPSTDSEDAPTDETKISSPVEPMMLFSDSILRERSSSSLHGSLR